MPFKTQAEKQAYDARRYAARRARELTLRPDDPIESLSSEERAYIAGIVDGEGSIFVSAVGPHRFKTVYPIVAIAMTGKPVIDWFCERMHVRMQLHNQTSLRLHAHYQPQYRFQVTGKRAKLLCAVILPYLKLKHEQAALVAAFPIDARIAPGVRLSDEIQTQRYALRDQINALNHPVPRGQKAVEATIDDVVTVAHE